MTYRNELNQHEAMQAKELVRLLKKMGQPQAQCAPPSFRTKVRARLDEKRGDRQRHTRGFGYRVPVAAAAGLVLGFGLAVVFLENEIYQPNLNKTLHFRGAETGPASTDTYQSPEEWLESIAELLVTGQVNEAYQQMTAFRQHYPKYEQDSAPLNR